MEEIDKQNRSGDAPEDEEQLLLNEVIRGDGELYFLHCYLTELFGEA